MIRIPIRKKAFQCHWKKYYILLFVWVCSFRFIFTMDNMENKTEDEIQTPNTTRSNSLEDEEDRTLEPVILRPNPEQTNENQSSSPRSSCSRISG